MGDTRKPKEAYWIERLNDQLETMSCARCKGLLVSDWCYDLENSGEYYVKVLRCVQCGHRIDPTIIKHQIRRHVPEDLEQAIRVRALMNSEDVEDAAVAA
jgi:Zn ribbon nucleic-acid-binding protein